MNASYLIYWTCFLCISADEPGLQIHLALTGDVSTMGVSWRSSSVVTPSVEYGLFSGQATRIVLAEDTRTYQFEGSSSGYYHHAEMSELVVGTKYKYRVNGTAWSAWHSFFTPAADDKVKLLFTGDFGLGGAGPPAGSGNVTANGFAAFAKAAQATDLIWVAGDISYANMHGGAHFEATWNSWFDALEPAFATVPVMVSPGNHETYLPSASADTTGAVVPPVGFLSEEEPALAMAASAWNFTAFDARFRMPSARSGGVRNMWFSIDVGGVHFVSINTETDFPHAAESFLDGWGNQLDWLKKDLVSFRQRSPEGWLVVIGHKPMYSSAPGYTNILGHPSGESANIQQTFESMFQQFSVDLYLAGHQHGYERSKPVYDNKVTSNGTVHIVAAVPGGGCGITADWKKGVPSWTEAQWPHDGSPWNDRQNAEEEIADLGFGFLEANATALSWTFRLSQGGAVKDAYFIRKASALVV